MDIQKADPAYTSFAKIPILGKLYDDAQRYLNVVDKTPFEKIVQQQPQMLVDVHPIMLVTGMNAKAAESTFKTII